MGEVVELETARRTRRVDELCKAVASDFCGVEVIDGTIVEYRGELEFYWSVDEAEERACELLKAVREAREER